MATDPKGYRFVVTGQPKADAEATHAARGAHDDWRINAEGRCFRAKMRGETVWAVQLTNDSKPTIYLTVQQAWRLGLCHCGRPATYVGFEGQRCDDHAINGMSQLCVVPDCTRVSETGFSSHCRKHTTPEIRAAHEAHQAEMRALYNRPYRYI